MNNIHPSDREIEAYVRRALISLEPTYFTWPPETRERFRLALSGEAEFHILRALLGYLFSIRLDTESEFEACFDSLDKGQSLVLNKCRLLVDGMGEDNFFLNEQLAEGKTLLDFPTLYEYDHDDYCYQERSRKELDPNRPDRPFRGSLYHTWARLQINGAFHYASLSVLAGYLCYKLEGFGSDIISDLIPHAFVDGEQHGKREGKEFIYDLRIDAGGREAHLDELKRRYYRYVGERYEALLEDFDQASSRKVYMWDSSEGDELHREFVFTDKSALREVRFRHFMSDCRRIAGDHQELLEHIDREQRASLAFIETAYSDVMENFDPKVVKFRRKRKIIVADRRLLG